MTRHPLLSLLNLRRRVRETKLRQRGFAEVTEEERQQNLESNLDWFLGIDIPDTCPGELSLEDRTW